jgi:hypothetical protein
MPQSPVSQRIDSLAQQIDSLSAEVDQDETSRKKLFDVVMKAVARLETPVDMIWRLIMSVCSSETFLE